MPRYQRLILVVVCRRPILTPALITARYKLWEASWADDAVIKDPKKGPYGSFSSPDRIREINHNGKFYNVPGPHICQPSPQRTPLLLQAGTSKSGKAFAAQHAEAVFVVGHAPHAVAANIKEVREMAQTQFGRDPQSLKFLAMYCPILGKTEQEAKAKFEDYSQYGSIEGAVSLIIGVGLDP